MRRMFREVREVREESKVEKFNRILRETKVPYAIELGFRITVENILQMTTAINTYHIYGIIPGAYTHYQDYYLKDTIMPMINDLEDCGIYGKMLNDMTEEDIIMVHSGSGCPNTEAEILGMRKDAISKDYPFRYYTLEDIVRVFNKVYK